MMRRHERTAYRLSATPATGEACALGNPQVLRALARLDGARTLLHDDWGPYVAFRATRHALMAAEATAAPVYVAPEYAELRRAVMSTPAAEAEAWARAEPRTRLRPMPHQREFCALAYPRRGMLNGSEQGTGKTLMAVMLAEAWGCGLTLVVTPKSIMRQWREEYLASLASPPEVVVLDDFGVDATVAFRAEVLAELSRMSRRLVAVLNYDVLRQMREALCELVDGVPTTLVLDESWRIKDPRAKVTQAVLAVAPRAEHALCLTGTPIGQGVGDLWSQLKVVECASLDSGAFESHKEWCAAYEATFVTDRGRVRPAGCKDPVGLMRRMEHSFYRATKATAAPDMPEKLPTHRVKLDLPPGTRALYNRVKADGESALGDGTSLMGERSTVLRLQQIVGGFVYNPDGTYTEEEAGQPHDLRLLLIGSPKLDWLLDFARDQLAGDPTYKVCVWCKFNAEVLHIQRRLAAALGEERVAPVLGDGPAGPGTTDERVERIKADINAKAVDGVQVAVVQFKKFAYGHNVQGIDHNVYYSHTWSHVEKSQSADRSHRMGRVGPVAYTELVAKRTVDETILSCTDNMVDMTERLAPDTVGAPRGL